jgi:hypothetical protein
LAKNSSSTSRAGLRDFGSHSRQDFPQFADAIVEICDTCGRIVECEIRQELERAHSGHEWRRHELINFGVLLDPRMQVGFGEKVPARSDIEPRAARRDLVVDIV